MAESKIDADTVLKTLVFARVRPLVESEEKLQAGFIKGLKLETEVRTKKDSVLVKEPGVTGFEGLIGVDSNNQATYKMVLGERLGAVLEGGNVNLFCYGHSGTGKTHTAMGYEKEPGLFKLACEDIFSYLAEKNKDLKPEDDDYMILQIRFTEVYLGKVYDLLRERMQCEEDDKGNFRIRAQPKKIDTGGKGFGRYKLVYTGDQAFNAVTDIKDLMETMKGGLTLRAAGSSSIHDQSSRSHALMEIEISGVKYNKLCLELSDALAYYSSEMLKPIPNRRKLRQFTERLADARKAIRKCLDDGIEQGRVLGGRLTLVDLAGADHDSRDLSRTTKAELRESAQINRELFVLKNCMRGLALKRKEVHLPWRDVKLTMFLKNILKPSGRSSQSIMIANISPSASQERDTVNTLRYAQMVAGLSEKEVNKNVDKDYRLKQNIRELYKSNSDKTDEEIEDILVKFKGRERRLLQMVLKKYVTAKKVPKRESIRIQNEAGLLEETEMVRQISGDLQRRLQEEDDAKRADWELKQELMKAAEEEEKEEQVKPVETSKEEMKTVLVSEKL